MYKYFLVSFMLAFSLVFSGLTTSVFAQNDTVNEAPVQRDTTNDAAFNNTRTDNNTGPTWMWLLPLLAIPLLFMFRKDSRNNDGELAGTKGGRSRERYENRELRDDYEERE